MAQKKFELATAYVPVMPSVRGIKSSLAKQFKGATRQLNKSMSKEIKSSSIGKHVADAFDPGSNKALGLSLARLRKYSSNIMYEGKHKGSTIDPTGLLNKTGAGFLRIGTRFISFIGRGMANLVLSFGRMLISSAISFGARMARSLATSAANFARSIAHAATNAIGIITGGIAGLTAIGGVKGFDRALDLNSAEARLKAMGYDAKKVLGDMKLLENISPKSLPELVDNATKLLGAGVKSGKELNKLMNSAVAASIQSGSDLNDVVFVFGQIASVGHAQLQDIYQLTERRIPVLQYLEKKLGKTRQEILQLISDRKISSQTVFDAMAENLADFRKVMKTDLRANWQALVNKYFGLFSTFFQPLVEGLVPVVQKVTRYLRLLTNDVRDNFSKSKTAALFQDFIDGLNKLTSKLSVSKTGDFFSRLDNEIYNFYNDIKKIKGPIIGLMIGIAGSFASNLPVIGPLFAGITPIVGLFTGAFLGAYGASKKLRNAVSKLIGQFKLLAEAILNFFFGGSKGDPMKKLGDFLARNIRAISDFVKSFTSMINEKSGSKFNILGTLQKIFTGVGNVIKDFIDEIIKSWPKIKSSFEGLFGTIGDVFNSPKGGASLGTKLADFVVLTITTISGILQVAIPLVKEIAGQISAIVQSDFFKTLIDWIVKIAKMIASNKVLVGTFITILTAWFIGKKLVGPILAALRFFKGPVAKQSGSATSGVMGFVKFVAAFIVIIAVIQELGNIMTRTSGGLNAYYAGLYAVVDFMKALVDVVKYIVVALQDVMFKQQNFAINQIMKMLDNFLGQDFKGVTDLMKNLASYGVEAGKGAAALGGGLVALAGGLTALTGADQVGSAIKSVKDNAFKFSGLGMAKGLYDKLSGAKKEAAKPIDPGTNPLQSMLTTMIQSLAEFTAKLNNFGGNIPLAMLSGLETNRAVFISGAKLMIVEMMTELQSYIDSNPLKLSVTSGTDFNMFARGAGIAAGNTITNYNATIHNSNNERAIRRGLRAT